MSQPQPEAAFPISLNENKDFLNGKLPVSLAVTSNSGAIALLAQNQTFPGADIELGDFQVRATPDLPTVKFGDGRGTVSFTASAGAFGSVGVYHTAQAAVKALHFTADDPAGETESLSNALVIPAASTELFCLFQAGYDVNGSLKGSVALGAAGTVDFSMSAGSTALFAVVRRFQNKIGAGDAVSHTLQTWKLPSQIKSAADLAPGTWLISEVNGTVSASIGTTLGYNFSFIRNARLGGLSGDIGLKVQLGLQATFGLTASGRHAVVIGRPSDAPVLRIAVYKLKLHGWNFALNASAAVTSTTPLPDKSDDFIKAVFGVHGAQVAKDLLQVDQLASLDPSKLPSALAGVSVDYFGKLVHQLTGIDPEQEFLKAKTKLVSALSVWDNLATTAQGSAMKLWKLLESSTGVDLSPIQSDLNKIAATKTPDDFKALLESFLPTEGFDQSPIGQFLFTVLENGPLQATLDSSAFQQVTKAAGLAGRLLDGSEVQDVVTKLQQFVNDKLGLDKIENAVKTADLDAFLQAKLGEFFKKELDSGLLAKVQNAVKTLESKREQIYEEVQKALNHTYSFTFAESYQSTTTDTAVADLEFDFSGVAAPAVNVSTLLQQAVDGRIGDLLLTPHAGVTVHSGVLSHGIKRDNHVEVTMPHFNFSEDDILDVTANLQADPSSGGGVFLLTAKDAVSQTSGHAKTLSSLSIGLKVPGVKRYSALSASYAYSFRQFLPNVPKIRLISELRPFVAAYFPNNFKAKSFDSWVEGLENDIEAKVSSFDATSFGNTLISLDVAMSEKAVEAWFSAPRTSKTAAAYMNLSLALQRSFKRLLPFQYFQDLHRYANLVSSASLIVYASIPPFNDMTPDNDGHLAPNPKGDLIWDYHDLKTREAMVLSSEPMILNRLGPIASMLQTAKLDHQFYDPLQVNVNRIVQDVLNQGIGFNDLDSLFFSEREVISGARDAAFSLAQFLGTPDPVLALKQMTTFGAKLAEAFDGHLDFIYQDKLGFLALGALAFLEAAQVFASSSGSIPAPVAMLGLASLKSGSKFTPDQFLQGGVPGPDDTLVSEHLPSA